MNNLGCFIMVEPNRCRFWRRGGTLRMNPIPAASWRRGLNKPTSESCRCARWSWKIQSVSFGWWERMFCRGRGMEGENPYSKSMLHIWKGTISVYNGIIETTRRGIIPWWRKDTTCIWVRVNTEFWSEALSRWRTNWFSRDASRTAWMTWFWKSFLPQWKESNTYRTAYLIVSSKRFLVVST